jgi:dTDP-4-dehydrorhamnose reductase
MAMRILLLGHSGQLGWELERCLTTLGEVEARDQPDLDLTSPHGLREVVHACRPNVIVNATAYTAVDQAERESDLAMKVNAESPRVMAEEARKAGAALVHFSTDYVFDGTTHRAYVETDPTQPINAYGRSKLAGEQAVQDVGGAYLILRTSWVYSLRRKSFVSQVLTWARSQPVLRVASDQVGSPTWCRALAEVTAQLLARGGATPVDFVGERSGVYHLAGRGSATRLEWARLILSLDPKREEQIAGEIQPAPSSEFPAAATRPLYSALDCTLFGQTFGLDLPEWKVALRLAMA